MDKKTKLLKRTPIPDMETDITLPMIYISLYTSSDNAKKLRDELYNDIIGVRNCTIYYKEKPEEKLDSAYNPILANMKAFVMPLNKISTGPDKDNMEMWKFDIKFAKAHDIPIIPIMLEPDLEEKSAPLIGPVNILSKVYNINDTAAAATYEEKLAESLERIFDNDRKKQEIKTVFRSKLFFSYRQRDRKDAIEIMKLIHEIGNEEDKSDWSKKKRNRAVGEDIAIWYDEFLGVTSDYHEYILKELDSSAAMILMVTPTLLKRSAKPDNYKERRGKEWYNYVVSKEYPEARKRHKKIIPVYAPLWYGEPLDEAEVERLLPGIRKKNPIRLDWNNTDEFRKVMGERLLKELHPKKIKRTGKRDYLLSEAYENGFWVEENHEKAQKLLESAAAKSDLRAIQKLSATELSKENLFTVGNKLSYTYILVDILKENMEKRPDNDNVIAYTRLLIDKSRHLKERGYDHAAWEDALEAFFITDHYNEILNTAELNKQLAECYEHIASFESDNTDKSKTLLLSEAKDLRNDIFEENYSPENARALARTANELAQGQSGLNKSLILAMALTRSENALASNPKNQDNNLLADMNSTLAEEDLHDNNLNSALMSYEAATKYRLAYARGTGTFQAIGKALVDFISYIKQKPADDTAKQEELDKCMKDCVNVRNILEQQNKAELEIYINRFNEIYNQ